MILKYSVENFRSIRDKLEISMMKESLKDDTQYKGFFDIGNLSVLITKGIFGNNASGKTAIVYSFASLANFISQSSNYTVSSSIPFYNPFKFRHNARGIPTKYNIKFCFNNFIYTYLISYTDKKVCFEQLSFNPNGKNVVVFTRNNSEISFSSSLVTNTHKDLIQTSLIPVKPIITLGSQFNIPVLKDAFSFFSKNIVLTDGTLNLNTIGFGTLLASNKKFNDFANSLVHAADLGISSFEYEKQQYKNPIVIPQNPLINQVQGAGIDFYKVSSIHHSNGKEFKLNIEDESLGTNKLMGLSGPIFTALSRGGVLIMDEFGASMHPDLSKLIISLFMDPEINKNKAQLIFASQESKLLSEQILRRDEISFAFKDEDGNTFLSSLSDYSARKGENYEIGFLNGRYIDTPSINQGKIKI